MYVATVQTIKLQEVEMARIYIEPTKARRSVQDEMELSRTLNGLAQEVISIRSALRYKIAGREQISERLRQVSQQILKEASSTRALGDSLQQIIGRYEQTENANRDRLVADKTDVTKVVQGADKRILDAINLLVGWPITTGMPIPMVIGAAAGAINWLFDGDTHYNPEIYSWKSDDGRKEEKVKVVSGVEIDLEDAFEDKDSKEKDSKKKDSEEGVNRYKKERSTQYITDEKTGKLKKVNASDKEAMEEFSKHNKRPISADIKILGAEASKSKSLFAGEGEKTGDFGGVSGSYGVSKGEISGEAYLSALGAGAAFGASYSVFTAGGKAYLGSEDYNVYAEGDVSFLKGEVKASVNAGLTDEEGNFNPSVYAGGSAEVIAAEVSGKVGVDVAGVDVGLEGSVNFGVGVHLDAGIHDGKISLDVGASLGVGASAKIEIDVSGAVNAVGNAIENVGSFISEFKLF